MPLQHTHESRLATGVDPSEPARSCRPSIEAARRLAVAIEHLPAVATLDWCDRAAGCVASNFNGIAAAVLLATVDRGGSLSHVEAVGVDTSSGAPSTDSGAQTTAPRVSQLRSDLEPLKSLPWREDAIAAWSAREVSGEEWDSTPIAHAFCSLNPTDIWLAFHAILGGDRRRGIVLLVAHASRPGSIQQELSPQERATLLGSACQHLAERAAIAIGVERCTRGGWISEREREVLDHLVLGKSVREIAVDVCRSSHTIHDHVKSLHRKLGASSRGELVARALGYCVRRDDANSRERVRPSNGEPSHSSSTNPTGRVDLAKEPKEIPSRAIRLPLDLPGERVA